MRKPINYILLYIPTIPKPIYSHSRYIYSKDTVHNPLQTEISNSGPVIPPGDIRSILIDSKAFLGRVHKIIVGDEAAVCTTFH